MVQTVRRTIVIPQLLYNGYRRPCCAGRTGPSPSLRRGSPHGPNCSFDHGHSQLQYTMADVPVELVMQVHFLVVAQRPFSHGQACLADHRDFAVAVRAGWSMFLLSFQDVLVGPCAQAHGQG